MEYDHRARVDSDEEEEEEEEGEGEGGTAEEDAQDHSFSVKKEPVVKRHKRDGEGLRPFRCEVCSQAFKEVCGGVWCVCGVVWCVWGGVSVGVCVCGGVCLWGCVSVCLVCLWGCVACVKRDSEGDCPFRCEVCSLVFKEVCGGLCGVVWCV